MKLRARWDGPLPAYGEWLISRSERARFAYQIEAIDIRTFSTSSDDPHHLTFTVDRIPIRVFHLHYGGQTIHSWSWDSRAPKKAKKEKRGGSKRKQRTQRQDQRPRAPASGRAGARSR